MTAKLDPLHRYKWYGMCLPDRGKYTTAHIVLVGPRFVKSETLPYPPTYADMMSAISKLKKKARFWIKARRSQSHAHLSLLPPPHHRHRRRRT